MKILIVILFIQTTLVVSSKLKIKKGERNVPFQNIHKTNYVLSTIKTRSASLCVASCAGNIDCRSVAYNRNDSRCQIYGRDFINQVVVGTSENGWTHYDAFPAECEYGWREWGGHCYYFSTDQRSWQNAQLQCLSIGSNLVKINDATEDAWIVSILKSLHGQNTWIGANKIGQANGAWVWVYDNSVLNYYKWASGEPSYGLEECVIIWTDYWSFTANKYRWNDNECYNLYYFICEK